jgi:predicted ATPase/DNA-binding CsgD family transcriptional regulator
LLDEFLDGYDELRILVTGIAPMRTGRERVIRVRPLPVPDPDIDLDHAQPSIMLFAERAAATDRAFHLDADNIGAVAAVCREVGGLPLAIELAAARVSSIPPVVLAEQLASRRGINLLRVDRAGRGGHQGSVNAALAWSYQLLSPRLRELLDQLAVFSATIPIEAAAAVVAPPRESLTDLLDEISELIDMQFLAWHSIDPRQPRFELVPMVRRFARTRLGHGASEHAVRDRHRAYYLNRCRELATQVRSGERAEAVRFARDDWAEVETAVDHAVLCGRFDDALQASVDAAAALEPVPWGQRAAHHHLGRLLESAAPAKDVHRTLLAQAMVATAIEPEMPAARQSSYGSLVNERLDAALAAARRSGDRRVILDALDLIVTALPITLNVTAAVDASREAHQIATELGDESALARFEMWEAFSARHHGDLDTAIRLAFSALRRAQAVSDDGTATLASALLITLPPGVRPRPANPPLPTMQELLAHCEATAQLRPAQYLLSFLNRHSVAAWRLDDAATYAARGLAIGLDRTRADPIGAANAIVDVIRIADALGHASDAAALFLSISPLHALLPGALPADQLSEFRDLIDRVRSAVLTSEYDRLAEQTRGTSLAEAVRLALRYARSVAATSEQLPAPPTPAETVAHHVSPSPPLTGREREVLVALATGATNKDIAAQFGLSAKTVMHHSVAIYHKLGVRGRAEATAWAYRNGLAETAST